MLIYLSKSYHKSYINHVCFRTVPQDTLALGEVYTWVIVSSVNVMATLTPATQRLASARYEALLLYNFVIAPC